MINLKSPSWDTTYTHDIDTHAETSSHTGQDWFSDVNASSKILRYLQSSALNLDIEDTSFLDLGTGNGEMLLMLREEGDFRGKMVGVDYSAASIHLCRKRLEILQEEAPEVQDIDFVEWDVIHQAPRAEWGDGFDVVLDKGTFDAISLSGERDGNGIGRRICERYREKVERLMRRGGCLIVTSCNWTEDELRQWFEGEELCAVGRVEYPVFKFGGQTGQSISTICFKKTS